MNRTLPAVWFAASILAASVVFPVPSVAATLAQWDFGSGPSPGEASHLLASSVAANVSTTGVEPNLTPPDFLSATPGSFTQASGTSISGYVLRLNGTYTGGGIDTTPVTGGKTAGDLAGNNNYWKLSLSALPSATLDIDSIEFDYSLVSTNRGWVLGYVKDGEPLVVVDSGIDKYNTGVTDYLHTDYTLNLSGVSDIEFRWYNFGNNSSNNKDLRFDNITILGDALVEAAPVPEPGSLVLALSGLLIFRITRRRSSLLA